MAGMTRKQRVRFLGREFARAPITPDLDRRDYASEFNGDGDLYDDGAPFAEEFAFAEIDEELFEAAEARRQLRLAAAYDD